MRTAGALCLAGGLAAAVPRSLPAAPLPRPEHVVVVIEENRDFERVIDNPGLPYIQSLVARGALCADAHGVAHPSQPNYFALFAGDTFGLEERPGPERNRPLVQPLRAPNLAGVLAVRGLSFLVYAQSKDSWPWVYARRHQPWLQFAGFDPAASLLPFERFPRDDAGYARLPTVSFVVPDDLHNMHSAPATWADQWLRDNLEGYVRWALTHQSLLVLTWDEAAPDQDGANRVATVFVGEAVVPGRYPPSGRPGAAGSSPERVDHYRLLRTLTDFYGLPALGRSRSYPPVDFVWKQP